MNREEIPQQAEQLKQAGVPIYEVEGECRHGLRSNSADEVVAWLQRFVPRDDMEKLDQWLVTRKR